MIVANSYPKHICVRVGKYYRGVLVEFLSRIQGWIIYQLEVRIILILDSRMHDLQPSCA